ncbi:hypothetical protein AMTRI_Chr12g274930 [Amborella trichopoda]
MILSFFVFWLFFSFFFCLLFFYHHTSYYWQYLQYCTTFFIVLHNNWKFLSKCSVVNIYEYPLNICPYYLGWVQLDPDRALIVFLSRFWTWIRPFGFKFWLKVGSILREPGLIGSIANHGLSLYTYLCPKRPLRFGIFCFIGVTFLFRIHRKSLAFALLVQALFQSTVGFMARC